MAQLTTLTYDELLPIIQQSIDPVFIVIHQPTVTISLNQIQYIVNNIQYLENKLYIIEFESIRTQLLEAFRAANINFAYLGFPCVALFYRQQIVFLESGALSISALNELAELAIEHFNQKSAFV